MKMKLGVMATGVSAQTWYACGVVDRVFAKHGYECVVTSLVDGQHNCGSKHTGGDAADFRVKHVIEADRQPIFAEIKEALDRHGYDTVWEGGVGATPATTGAHIHVEYDPKAGEIWVPSCP